MKAALLYEKDPVLRVEDVPIPSLDYGEVLLKVQATGLCRTDLKFLHGFLRPKSFPHVLGHEIAGTVVESRPSINMEREILETAKECPSVLVYPDVGCGHCTYCIEGRMNLCNKLQRPGFELSGGFADYVRVPIRNLIPTSLGREAAVLTDAGANMLHALRRARLEPGMVVVLAGVGGLGTMAVQLARLFGCTVIALDIDDEKSCFCKRTQRRVRSKRERSLSPGGQGKDTRFHPSKTGGRIRGSCWHRESIKGSR